MEEQIFNIMLKWINVPYVKGKDYPTGIQGMGPSAQEITTHVMEFVGWEHLNTITHNSLVWYIVIEPGSVRHTLNEVYQYWLKNVKDESV
jgi:hypothetical protein